MFSIKEPEQIDDRTCVVCKEHDYQQRMSAKLVTCAWCEQEVCEDCTVTVQLFSQGGFSLGTAIACIDCVDD